MAFSTIDKSSSFTNPKIYTGTGSSNALTGVGFQPDLTWIKCRSTAENHRLFDAVRGVQKYLASNNDYIEATDSTTLTAFGADGFTVDTAQPVNGNTKTYVSWNWKAGTTSGLSGGTITPDSYSFNTTSGFSILKYEGNASAGATIPHGLGVVPKMIIIKRIDGTGQWAVYHGANTSAPETDYLYLNGNGATSDDNSMWNDTAPTSSVFSVGTSSSTNGSGNDYIAYCFAAIPGYSRFGLYYGNGVSNSDGSFIYTGFKPSFIMVKRTNGTKNWHIFDTARSTYNLTKADLEPNTDAVEDTSNDWLDIVSNGFKWRIPSGDADYGDVNGDGDTYIYAAFGQPIVSNSGTPATAR